MDNNFEYEILIKIADGVLLTEREIKNLVDEYAIETIAHGLDRWTEDVETIVELRGVMFSIRWEKAKTESQDDYFRTQPEEVQKKEYEKTIVVTEWDRNVEKTPLAVEILEYKKAKNNKKVEDAQVKKEREAKEETDKELANKYPMNDPSKLSEAKKRAMKEITDLGITYTMGNFMPIAQRKYLELEKDNKRADGFIEYWEEKLKG